MSRKSQLSKQKTEPSGAIAVSVSSKQELFSGPLPHPDQLARYEEISPGFAQEILAMAKSSQKHAQEMERSMMNMQKDFTRQHLKYFGRGQVIAGILGGVSVIGGCVVAGLGHAAAGVSIIGSVMAILGAAFAFGKWSESKPPAETQE